MSKDSLGKSNSLSDMMGKLNPVGDMLNRRDENMQNFYKRFSEADKRLQESKRQEVLDKRQYDSDVLETLKGIEKNTGDIARIIDLLQTSSANQGKILQLLSEIQSIAAAKNANEADTKYREVMKKVTQLEEDASSIDTLVGYSRVVWTGVKAYLKSSGIDNE